MEKYLWMLILTAMVSALPSNTALPRLTAEEIAPQGSINGISKTPFPHEQSDMRQKVELPQREVFPQAEADYFAGHPDALIMLTVIYDAYTKKVSDDFQQQEFILAIIDDDKTDRHKKIFVAVRRLFPNAKLKCIHTSDFENIPQNIPLIKIFFWGSSDIIGCWINDMKDQTLDSTTGLWRYHFEKTGDTYYLQRIRRPRA